MKKEASTQRFLVSVTVQHLVEAVPSVLFCIFSGCFCITALHLVSIFYKIYQNRHNCKIVFGMELRYVSCHSKKLKPVLRTFQ